MKPTIRSAATRSAACSIIAGIALLAAGCGGGGGPSPAPAPSAISGAGAVAAPAPAAGAAPAPAPAPVAGAPAAPAPAPAPGPSPAPAPGAAPAPAAPPAAAPPAAPAVTVSAGPVVAAGSGFSIAVRANGNLASWGDQELGVLGNGVNTASSTRVPQAVLVAATVRQVAAGAFHTLALRADGTVLSWGANGSGRLGNGSDGGGFATPDLVTGAVGVIAVAAGRAHSLALRADGAVLAWGDNAVGQLGLGDTVARVTPTVVPGLAPVVAIAAGGQQSFAIRADGVVFAWGNNTDGQLGLGDATTRVTPTAVTALNGRNVVQIAAGRFHTLARTAAGTVFAWGSSLRGQVGVAAAGGNGFGTFRSPVAVTALANVAALAAGDEHSLALLADGSVRAWGHAGSGRLGTGVSGITQSTFVPQQVNVGGVVSIAAGSDHSLFAVQDGRVGCAGSNFFSQCGRIEITDLTVPVEVGPGFSRAQ